MNVETYTYGTLKCSCMRNPANSRISYILYPMDALGPDWIESAVTQYETSIAVITGMDWDNDLTPWAAPGVPKGSPDFKGLAPEFLNRLTGEVIPGIERSLGIVGDAERTLIGVSLSGLFTLWQWPQTDYFKNIATLSGSFWYEGFEPWVLEQSFAGKSGKCFMLLGEAEPHSSVPMFRRVGECTETIVGFLRRQGVDVSYRTVPGNHYQHPLQRLALALTALAH